MSGQHTVREMPLQSMRTVSREVEIAARIIQIVAKPSEWLDPDIGFRIHKQVPAGRIDAQLTKSIAWRR